MQLPGDISTCGATAGVFAQPRPKAAVDADNEGSLEYSRKCSALRARDGRILDSRLTGRTGAPFRFRFQLLAKRTATSFCGRAAWLRKALLVLSVGHAVSQPPPSPACPVFAGSRVLEPV